MTNFLLLCAWIIILFATIASLYGSEVMNFSVCKLCWYQRICIYPLSIFLGIAAYKNDVKIIPYAIPLLIIGTLIGLYQYLLQMFPNLHIVQLCHMNAINNCANIDWSLFGWITFPLLSVMACLLVIILLIGAYWLDQ